MRTMVFKQMGRMGFLSRKFYSFLLLFSIAVFSCKNKADDANEPVFAQNTSTKYVSLAMDMADAEMKRNPEAWMLDFNSQPRWNYTYGVVCTAFEWLWKYTDNQKYYNYILEYADLMVNSDGSIKTYDLEDYNIDMINTGKFLFAIYEETGDEKYKKALNLLREQMKTHPRTSEGGFWHKKRYPWQMWLDGLYMGSPFLAQYAFEFDEPELYDDVANQIHLITKYTRNPQTGLFYHGWDESKEQAWADKETGLSQNFWGRGMGWFAMALVDVLDYFPKDHSQYNEILEITANMAEAIKDFQDEKSGVWYQVLDKVGENGNYPESSASTMFVYFLYKAVRKGYIDREYMEVADKGLGGILHEFIEKDGEGNVEITRACAGAGLGGNPYRDGTYEYYINESVRSNDPKAVGPYIYLLLEKAKIEKNHQD